jgi:hypothetical protein
MKNKLSTTLIYLHLVSLLLVNPSFGFFRHLCHGTLGTLRVDPLMAPGKASQHIHDIHGASSKLILPQCSISDF